jgi:hypothetical protein
MSFQYANDASEYGASPVESVNAFQAGRVLSMDILRHRTCLRRLGGAFQFCYARLDVFGLNPFGGSVIRSCSTS